MNIRELSPELKKKADEKFGVHENLIIEYVEYITEWLQKQPHICARIEPQWLVVFLRGCKYSLEKTKAKIDLLYTTRTHLPEFFHNRDPADPKIEKMLDMGIYCPLPLLYKPDSTHLTLIRPALYDPQEFTISEVIRTGCIMLDLSLMLDDRLTVNGTDIVIDVVGSRLEHLGQLTPTIIKQSIVCIQDAYPVQIRSIHIINPLPMMDTIFSIVKRLLNKKLRDRMMFHTDINNLFKYIPQQVFPVEYGGEGPSLADQTKEWKKMVMENRNWYLEDAQYKVTESKRPGKQVTSMDLFGVDGSFKKLDFD